MSEERTPHVAILDYGVGNLFSVKNACEAVDLDARITAERDELLAADAVIVPGVGAFGDAMQTLTRLDLVSPLRDIAASGTPLVGICLGMQLFMTESEEFGRHEGLGFFSGAVRRFDRPRSESVDGSESRALKVPQVGWNRILPCRLAVNGRPEADPGARWAEWPLEDTAPGEFMYFVHSYYAVPDDPAVVLSLTRYGDTEFCSSVKRDNIFACQFHPERSGETGLDIYRSLARHIAAACDTSYNAHAR